MSAKGGLERWIFLGLGITVAAIAVVYLWRNAHSTAKPLAVTGVVPAFSLTNQLGRAVSLNDLRGQIWVADIIFSRCAGPCPQLTRTVQRLDQELSGVADLRWVSLTADPAFDTPEVLAKYAQEYGAKESRWWFLTGPKPDVYRLAMDGLKLGVEEKEPSARENLNDLFIHSTVLTLVDKRGRLRGFYRGMEADSLRELTNAVHELAKEN